MNSFIDNHFYFTTFCVGFLTIVIFDYSAITDDIFIFIIVSPVMAPFLGAIIMICLVILRGLISFIFDFIELVSYAIKNRLHNL